MVMRLVMMLVLLIDSKSEFSNIWLGAMKLISLRSCEVVEHEVGIQISNFSFFWWKNGPYSAIFREMVIRMVI